MLLAGRQCGKSAVAAALAVKTALEAASLILLVSATHRQSKELFGEHILPTWRGLGAPQKCEPPKTTELRLANGSRIVCLPENEEGIRCFSAVRLIIIDEAARVSDALYYAVRPMLMVSRGRLLALTTPFGKRGWFYEAWRSQEKWHRVRTTARDCPRHTREDLAAERQGMGERWFNQEYLCSFEDIVGAVFSGEDIAAAFSDDVQPLFAPRPAAVDDVPALFGSGEL